MRLSDNPCSHMHRICAHHVPTHYSLLLFLVNILAIIRQCLCTPHGPTAQPPRPRPETASPPGTTPSSADLKQSLAASANVPTRIDRRGQPGVHRHSVHGACALTCGTTQRLAVTHTVIHRQCTTINSRLAEPMQRGSHSVRVSSHPFHKPNSL